MRKLGYIVIHLIELIRFFGFVEGVKIFCKIIFTSKISTIEFKSNHFKNSINIRKKDSDLEIFYQVFAELQYNVLVYFDSEPKNIIDCGGNVGFSALYFAYKFPNAQIAVFEPQSNNFAQLQYNTRDYKNVKCYNAAVWHQRTELTIKDEKEWSGSFEVKENTDKSAGMIQGMTLDEIALENEFETIDILKIDIEGAEYHLFANDPHTWLAKTKCLIIELHDHLQPGTTKAFFEAMAKYNWRTLIKGENIICFKQNF